MRYRYLRIITALTLMAGIVVMGTITYQPNRAEAQDAASSDAVAHGKYLVENVGMCADCHTPKDPKGAPIEAKHLKGAILDFKPSKPVPGWLGYAPGIAGLPPGWTKEDMSSYMQDGKKPGGVEAAPPMPKYRLNKEDADAVAEYLASLGTK